MARPIKDLNPIEVQNLLTQHLRLTAVNPSIAAYKPQDYQVTFHSSEKKGKLFIGGNRSGKTVGGATEAVWWLTGKHQFRTDIPKPPVQGRICAVDFDNGVELITKPEVKKWMPPSLLIDGSWEASYNKSLRMLTLANGSTVEFRSYDQDMDKFAGTSRHFVWFDEEPPENIFNENMLRLVDVGGSWWMTMTPLIEMSWVEDRIYDPWTSGDKTFDVFEVNTQQNKYIKEENLIMALVGMDRQEQIARASGTFIKHSGLVYKSHFTQENVVPDIVNSDDWSFYRRNWGHIAMMDHGYRNPTAFLFACYDTDGNMIVYDEIYQREKLVHENAKFYLDRVESLGIRPEYIIGDPTIASKLPVQGKSGGSTSVHIEYAENGVYIALGFHDLSPGISRVQSRFDQNALFITERCEKLLWEINRYRWDRFASSKIAVRRNVKEKPLAKDDHALDALRYGVCSRPALPGEVDLPVGNVLNSAVARRDPYEFDWEKFTAWEVAENQNKSIDPNLGNQW